MNKETKFTKGEWEVEYCDLPITNSECYYMLNDEGNCIADVYIKEDAHLIKAAPKLYSEIESEIEFLKELREYSHTEYQITLLDEKIDQKQDLLAEARGE